MKNLFAVALTAMLLGSAVHPAAAQSAREQQAVAAAVSACSGAGASSDACIQALATVLALGLSNPALLQNKQIGQLVAKVSPAKLQAAVATVVAQITGQKIDVKQVTAIIDTSRTAGSAA